MPLVRRRARVARPHGAVGRGADRRRSPATRQRAVRRLRARFRDRRRPARDGGRDHARQWTGLLEALQLRGEIAALEAPARGFVRARRGPALRAPRRVVPDLRAGHRRAAGSTSWAAASTPRACAGALTARSDRRCATTRGCRSRGPMFSDARTPERPPLSGAGRGGAVRRRRAPGRRCGRRAWASTPTRCWPRAVDVRRADRRPARRGRGRRQPLIPLCGKPSMTSSSAFLAHLAGVVAPARAFAAAAEQATRQLCAPSGRPEAALLQQHQRALHGLAWIATTVEAIHRAGEWGERLAQRGRSGPGEELALTIGIGEYLAQLAGGVPMSQNEIFRPAELGIEAAVATLQAADSVRWFVVQGGAAADAARVGRSPAQRPRHRRDRLRRRPRHDPRSVPTLRDERDPAARSGLAPGRRADSRRGGGRAVRARRLRRQHSCRVRRHGARQAGDVHRHRGAEPRLDRGRLARHAFRDRRRADPRRRNAGAEVALAAQDRQRRGAADRGVHRARHRLRPRVAAHARNAAARRPLARRRQQDLDHACVAQRPDDPAGPHRARPEGARRPVDAPCRQAARHARAAVPGTRHERRRDPGARLPRHARVRDRVRRFRDRPRRGARRSSAARASAS